ncbi:V-type proton ATPase subunit S1-like [Chiloscyllium plagiosum]|uniref:V-type proton ATPase subunit S1-like n=1 Tax=Chiloscyllium plagiosum TaxID=36176 RepID=UPI001CB85625|nr:V-type proton ATPase subunit S1-like [Chiloscyllium plagiosum]
MVVMGPSRQLLASREEVEVTERGTYPPVAYNQTVNRTCILFWAGSIQISKGGHVVELTNRTFGPGATVDVSSSTCTNQTANLVLEYENVEELGSVRIVFRMSNQLYKVSAKWWFTVDQVEVYSDGDRASFNVTQIYAPAIYSYHCQRVAHDTQSGSILPWSTSTQHWVVIFEDFQVWVLLPLPS